MSHTTAGPAPTPHGEKKYPDPIAPDVLARLAHISDEEIVRDISDTEAEIARYERLEEAERTIASTHHNKNERRLADFRANARPLQIAERRSFVEFLQRLQAARASAATVALVLLTVALSGCVLFRPWAPQPSAPPRECVGRFVYPDSAGHCVPRESSARVR